MSKVFDNFIIPMRMAFDDPFDVSEKNDNLWFRLDSALDHFSVDTLQQAVIALQNIWKSLKFPPQAVCVAACVDVHEKKGKQKTEYPVIHVNSAEWEAWEAHYKNIAPFKARLMVNSVRGVWTVPSMWPPADC